jgi:hypothetical protein
MRESIHRIQIAALGTAVLVMVGLLWPTAGLTATGKELLKCQKMMLNQSRSYAKVTWSKLLNCTQKVGDCQLAEEIDGLDATGCVANVSVKKCDPLVAKLSEQQAKRELKTVLKCGLLTLAELEQFIGGLGYSGVVAACAATDVNTLVSCVFDDVRCNAEGQLFIADPRAQASLVAVGLDASFPCVAP